MNPERLLQNFDRLIDTPDAVPRLRRFILDLAVRGKLVEQNPEDEPGRLLSSAVYRTRMRFSAKIIGSWIAPRQVKISSWHVMPSGSAVYGRRCMWTTKGSRTSERFYRSLKISFP